MTPIKFTEKNGAINFHYKTSELIDFVRKGKKDGNVGLIITKREGDVLTFRGFGTIEKPFNEVITLHIAHNNIFGNMITDEQRLKPPKPDGFNKRIITFDSINIKKVKIK